MHAPQNPTLRFPKTNTKISTVIEHKNKVCITNIYIRHTHADTCMTRTHAQTAYHTRLRAHSCRSVDTTQNPMPGSLHVRTPLFCHTLGALIPLPPYPITRQLTVTCLTDTAVPITEPDSGQSVVVRGSGQCIFGGHPAAAAASGQQPVPHGPGQGLSGPGDC